MVTFVVLLWNALLKPKLGEAQCVNQVELPFLRQAWGPAASAHISPGGS